MERALQSQRAQWRPRQQSGLDKGAEHRSNGIDECEGDAEDYCDDNAASEDESDENQGHQSTENHKAQRRRRSGGQRRRLHFEIRELQQLYHLPLKTAAERLGICEAALKRICRRNQIKKWPYRQLQSIRRRMSDLEDQENTRPSNSSNASTLDSLPIQQHAYEKVNIFGTSRIRNEQRSSFLLPHEMKRDQLDHASLNESSESALPKSEKLALLEEERQRVISLAHLTSKARRPKPDISTHEASTSRAASNTSLTFEELLSWSVPAYDSLQDEGPPKNQVQPCPTNLRRDSALLLLANVCSSEEKIRELHARRLAARRQENDWQQHNINTLTSCFTVPNH